MNAEIVGTLEKEYPPISYDPKFEELRELLLQYLGGPGDLDDADTARLDILLSEMNRMGRKVKKFES